MLQKRAVSAIYKLRHEDTNIFTLPSQFIFENINNMYARKNVALFSKNCDGHKTLILETKIRLLYFIFFVQSIRQSVNRRCPRVMVFKPGDGRQCEHIFSKCLKNTETCLNQSTCSFQCFLHFNLYFGSTPIGTYCC